MRCFRRFLVSTAITICFFSLSGCNGNNDNSVTQTDTAISSFNAVSEFDDVVVSEEDPGTAENLSGVVETDDAFYIPESMVEAPNAKIRKPMPPQFGKDKMIYPIYPDGYSFYSSSNSIYLINEKGEEISPNGETYQQVDYVYDNNLHVQGIVAMKLVRGKNEWERRWEVTLFNRSGDIILSFTGDCTAAPPGCGPYIICVDTSYRYRVFDVVKESYVSGKIKSTSDYPDEDYYSFVAPGKIAVYDPYSGETSAETSAKVYDISSKSFSTLTTEEFYQLREEMFDKADSLLPNSEEYGHIVADGLYYWGKQGSYYGYRDKDGNWFWRDFVHSDYSD